PREAGRAGQGASVTPPESIRDRAHPLYGPRIRLAPNARPARNERALPHPRPADLPQLRPVVARRDPPHRPGPGAHDERLRGRPRGRVVHAVEHVAVGHAGGGEEDVVAGHEAVDVEHLVEVVAALDRPLALLVVARPEAAEHLAA